MVFLVETMRSSVLVSIVLFFSMDIKQLARNMYFLLQNIQHIVYTEKPYQVFFILKVEAIIF